MRIKLLNDGGYGDTDAVSFPVEVDAVDWEGEGFEVSGAEIIRAGGNTPGWDAEYKYLWLNRDVEVLP